MSEAKITDKVTQGQISELEYDISTLSKRIDTTSNAINDIMTILAIITERLATLESSNVS